MDKTLRGFRSRTYLNNGLVALEYSDNLDYLADKLNYQVLSGDATGGDIDEWVDGIGWVISG